MIRSIEDVQKYFKNHKSLGIKPGLERMAALLKKLNHPEKKLKALHVAGTNGKGSTVHMIRQGFIANGYKVGTFSSPSFAGLGGHFFINDEPMSETTLVELMKELKPIIDQLDAAQLAPTNFEILTAIAFVYFERHVDFAIVEAGMGGRYDTTNCIEPMVSIITSISYDHEQFLGSSLEAIASHKAGIIKKERPVIVGPVHKKVKNVIREEASEKQAPTYFYGEAFSTTNESSGQFTWHSTMGKKLDVSLSLVGHHQIENAAIALQTFAYLETYKVATFSWEKIVSSMRTLQLKGRFEVLLNEPTIIVDSAHNEAGIRAFIATAKEYKKTSNSRLLFAGFKDKRLEPMVNQLLDASFSVTLTTFNHERAAEKEDFDSILTNHPSLNFASSWKEFIQHVIHTAQAEETLFITGSLHFVTQVRQFIEEHVKA